MFGSGELSPQAAAALVAGLISILTTVTTLLVSRSLQKDKQHHDRDLESIKAAASAALAVHKATLDSALESHKAALAQRSADYENRLDAELARLQSELKTTQALYASSLPLQQRVREHLSKTRHLLGRVYISFSRLAHLAPSLQEEAVLVETTNTLDLYAEYRQHLSSDEYVSYPDAVKSALDEIQHTLAKIFLDLQIDESSRTDAAVAAKMSDSLKRLESLRDSVTRAIESIIRVRIDPLQ
jgi:hypothetical protein